MSLLVLEKRLSPGRGLRVWVTLGSILLSLFLSGLLIRFAAGISPLRAYSALFREAFGTDYGLSEVVVLAGPLILCGLAVALSLKMKLWNIGAEGQYIVGGLAAGLIALRFPDLPGGLLMPLMGAGAFLAGAAWGGLAGALRARLGVNEIITTLMLNWIAGLLAGYFAYGPLRGPDGFPFSPEFSPGGRLPFLGWNQVHAGIFIALAAAAVLYFTLKKTVWGFELSVIGDNPTAARYAGMNISRNILLVLLLSGGLAGLGGFTVISGVDHRIPRVIGMNYGYTAIVIAWLARGNPLAVVLVAGLFAGFFSGGESIQIDLKVPLSVVLILEGSILFFLLAGELLMEYRLRFNLKSHRDPEESSP